jgi:uncharacterized membrane protein YhaH (DUF805 family)
MERDNNVFLRRRKRRARKKIRQTMATLGGLGMVIAIGSGGFAIYMKNDRMLNIAIGYFFVSLLFLFISWIFFLLSRPKRSHDRHRSQETYEAGNDSGMALVAVLLLVALVGALTVQAQASAAVQLKYARVRQTISNLRLAATDAVLYAARAQMKDEKSDLDGGADTVITLPSGVRVETHFTEIKDIASIAPGLMTVAPRGGKYLMIEASAESKRNSEEVACLMHKPDNKAASILVWVENR